MSGAKVSYLALYLTLPVDMRGVTAQLFALAHRSRVAGLCASRSVAVTSEALDDCADAARVDCARAMTEVAC